MANNHHISDELLAAYLEGNVNKKEMTQVLQAVGEDTELQEALDIALQLEEEELPLQMAAEGGRNLCAIQCEAFVLKRHGISCTIDELLEIAKEHHWIHRAGTPLNCIGNLLESKGVNVVRKKNGTISNIKNELVNGKGVIVAVDSDKLYPERPDEEDATNHAVVVTGIKEDTVTIYDPGNITEVDIELSLFIYAWKESHNFAVFAN